MVDTIKYYRYSQYSVIYFDDSQFHEEYSLLWLEAKKKNLHLHDSYRLKVIFLKEIFLTPSCNFFSLSEQNK